LIVKSDNIKQTAVAVASTCEIAIIVALQFPSNSFATKVLSLLMPTSEILLPAQQIHVTRVFFMGFLLANLGGFIRLICFSMLGRLFTFELSVRKNHELITDGPYSVVRHPSYTGGFAVVFGVALCHLSSGSWLRESGVLENGVVRGLVFAWIVLAVAFQGMVFVRVKKEDDMLRAAFGKSWDIWAQSVKYRLVPGVF
jgi:protein-S-isoprenylcysteine O-methyltransferase Ste14